MAQRWLKADAYDGFAAADVAGLSSKQMQAFLDAMLMADKVSTSLVAAMDKAYNMASYKNSEIRFRWQVGPS